MARRIDYSNRCKKDFRRAEKRGKDMTKLRTALQLLVENGALPPRYRSHPLKGNWAHHLECHIEPDWLLIYQIDEEALYLVATGTHSDLFK